MYSSHSILSCLHLYITLLFLVTLSLEAIKRLLMVLPLMYTCILCLLTYILKALTQAFGVWYKHVRPLVLGCSAG